MGELNVQIEINGTMVPVGIIRGENPSEACFSYLPEYMDRAGARPISISLPFQAEAFSTARTRNFFDGMLPEGFTRRSVAQWVRADEDDYIALLASLGKECLGAVQITEKDGGADAPQYRKLAMEEIRALAAEGATRSAEILKKTHLSLTGATGKVGLYFRESENAWYYPSGTAPSTHIVKQSHVRLKNIVLNEQLCLRTAALLGLPVPESFIIDAGGGEDKDVLFATRRYDREFGEHSCDVDGLPVPMRLHQEDFAQAMGIHAFDKYEKPGENYLFRMFSVLRDYSSDPIADQMKLWDIVVFDYLIGNTDNHIKNCSLLYGPDLRQKRLAPAYDILSTAVYPESTRNMAYHIGDADSLDRITRNSFEIAAEELHLGKKNAMKHFDGLADRLEKALREAAGELSDHGFVHAGRLRDAILRKGGISRLG
ncbi:MAG: HipA domain-containing protein [Clostridium sp.]|nr:HipA domain-containing protein [Clostridium sp.]